MFFKKSVTKSTIFVTLFGSKEQKSSKKHIYEADNTKDLALIEELSKPCKKNSCSTIFVTIEGIYLLTKVRILLR